MHTTLSAVVNKKKDDKLLMLKKETLLIIDTTSARFHSFTRNRKHNTIEIPLLLPFFRFGVNTKTVVVHMTYFTTYIYYVVWYRVIWRIKHPYVFLSSFFFCVQYQLQSYGAGNNKSGKRGSAKSIQQIQTTQVHIETEPYTSFGTV